MTYKEHQIKREIALMQYKQCAEENSDLIEAFKTYEYFHNAANRFLELNPTLSEKELK